MMTFQTHTHTHTLRIIKKTVICVRTELVYVHHSCWGWGGRGKRLTGEGEGCLEKKGKNGLICISKGWLVSKGLRGEREEGVIA